MLIGKHKAVPIKVAILAEMMIRNDEDMTSKQNHSDETDLDLEYEAAMPSSNWVSGGGYRMQDPMRRRYTVRVSAAHGKKEQTTPLMVAILR